MESLFVAVFVDLCGNFDRQQTEEYYVVVVVVAAEYNGCGCFVLADECFVECLFDVVLNL